MLIEVQISHYFFVLLFRIVKWGDEITGAGHTGVRRGEVTFPFFEDLMCARKYITGLLRLSQQTCEENAMISVLQIRKPGLREVKSLLPPDN